MLRRADASRCPAVDSTLRTNKMCRTDASCLRWCFSSGSLAASCFALPRTVFMPALTRHRVALFRNCQYKC